MTKYDTKGKHEITQAQNMVQVEELNEIAAVKPLPILAEAYSFAEQQNFSPQSA